MATQLPPAGDSDSSANGSEASRGSFPFPASNLERLILLGSISSAALCTSHFASAWPGSGTAPGAPTNLQMTLCHSCESVRSPSLQYTSDFSLMWVPVGFVWQAVALAPVYVAIMTRLWNKTGSELYSGFRRYSITRASLSPCGFHAGLSSNGPVDIRLASSRCTLYVKATADLGVMEETSIVYSSGFSSETGWINVRFGPMASKLGKLLIRTVRFAIICQYRPIR